MLIVHTQTCNELNHMEILGVISKVETPTPWCAGMAVVPKSSGEVRICMDLKPLNESVVHPLPRVETALAQLSGAKLKFSQNLTQMAAFGKSL